MSSHVISPAELRKMFETRLAGGIPNPPGEFHPLDLERVNDDQYLSSIIGLFPDNAKLALDLLWDIMVWRKTVGASDINENNIRMDYVNEGFVFPRGRDIDGCRLVIFIWKKHAKGTKDIRELERVLIYWLDRIEREERGKKFTLFFDVDGSGLNSVDMDLIKCLISLFKARYPHCVQNVIIYQLPLYLTAAFKVILALLPARDRQVVKVVRKDNLKDVVPPEQALTCWGGMDDYAFEFVPEKREEHTPKNVPDHHTLEHTSKTVPDHHTLEHTPKTVPDHHTPEHTPKTVPDHHTLEHTSKKVSYHHTLEDTPKTVPDHHTLEHTSKKVPDHHTLGEMLRLVPNDVIIFKNDNNEVSGHVTITNMNENVILFKIRTTSPEKFRVRPSSGTLSPGTSKTILIVVQQGFPLRTVSKDKFLIMSVQIPKTDMSQKELSEVWLNSSGSEVDKYKLKCQFGETNVANNSNVIDGGTQEEADSVVNALDNLQMKYETLHETVKTMQYVQVFIILLIVVVMGFVCLIYQNQKAVSSSII